MPCENSARKRSKTMAFRCTPEEHKLICEMAAWSGMSRQDYIIAKLTDTQVEVRPSVSVHRGAQGSCGLSLPIPAIYISCPSISGGRPRRYASEPTKS
ncbi:plasmid mobilization protein [Schaalia turicensis]